MASSASGTSAPKSSLRGGKSDKDRSSDSQSLSGPEGRKIYDRPLVSGSKPAPPDHDGVKAKHAKPKESQQVAPQKRKLTLKDYNQSTLKDFDQTQAAAEAILSANSKKLETPERGRKKAELMSPPRKRRDVSSSPSPARSPVREKDRRIEQIQDPATKSLSNGAKLLLDSFVGMSEEEARDRLNFFNMQRMAGGSEKKLPKEDSKTRSESKNPRDDIRLDTLPPAPMPQLLPHMAAQTLPQGLPTDLMSMFLMNAAQLMANQNQNAKPSKRKVIKVESEEDDEDMVESEEEEESPIALWSGLNQEFKNDGVFISDMAKIFWASVNSTDAKGRKDLSFKKPFKRASKLKFYTEGDDMVSFRPPQRNPELPKLEGYRMKEEEDLVSFQKGIGAAAAASCAAVDSLRSLVNDVQASAQDFAEGNFQDPGQEAEFICNSVARMVEEGAIANIIQSVKFLGGAFAFGSFKRHMLALRLVTAEDAKKVLSDSPPDASWLFGAEIKDRVQQIRDSGHISRAFYARGNSSRGGYRNFGNRGRAGKFSGGYVPRDRRFKGTRGFSYKKTRKFQYGGKGKEKEEKSKEKDE